MVAYPPGNGIFISGGYCKVKDTNKGAQGKSFADSWWLNMTQINADIASKATPIRVWEKLGRNAALPSPRSGISHSHPLNTASRTISLVAQVWLLCHTKL